MSEILIVPGKTIAGNGQEQRIDQNFNPDGRRDEWLSALYQFGERLQKIRSGTGLTHLILSQAERSSE